MIRSIWRGLVSCFWPYYIEEKKCTHIIVSLYIKELQPITTALAMIGKLFSTAAFATIYVLSAEIFPTAIRNAGMGSSSAWARVGGMISPFIADTVSFRFRSCILYGLQLNYCKKTFPFLSFQNPISHHRHCELPFPL